MEINLKVLQVTQNTEVTTIQFGTPGTDGKPDNMTMGLQIDNADWNAEFAPGATVAIVLTPTAPAKGTKGKQK